MPGEVADAVAVRILERARIDLVDHRAAPPVAIGRQRLVLVKHQYAVGPRVSSSPKDCFVLFTLDRREMDCQRPYRA